MTELKVAYRFGYWPGEIKIYSSIEQMFCLVKMRVSTGSWAFSHCVHSDFDIKVVLMHFQVHIFTTAAGV